MKGVIEEEVDYIGVGLIYEIFIKLDKVVIGLEYISYVVKNCFIFWFVIGGIDM